MASAQVLYVLSRVFRMEVTNWVSRRILSTSLRVSETEVCGSAECMGRD